MRGFFSASELASGKAPAPTIAQCGACGLLRQCRSPKLKPVGNGRSGILLVGEGPTPHDDAAGRLLASSNLDNPLEKAMRFLGVDILEDCWYTAATICYAESGKREEMAEFCRPNLVDVVQELKPLCIVPLGPYAVRSVLGWLWKEDVGSISRWVGWNIPSQKLNTWICPTYGPHYIQHYREPVAYAQFQAHLQRAFSHKSRPFETVPDYKAQVRVELDDEAAAEYLQWVYNHAARRNWESGSLSFDYETDRLKPDADDAKIITASICYAGRHCIAFPWTRRTREALGALLFCPIPKTAANYKFEERWTRAKFGQGVTNWKWCTLLGAHGLDPRPDICSLKYQAFIRLGQESYDTHLHRLLEAPTANSSNRWRDIEISQLLLYNGLDSILEYHVAESQMQEWKERSNAE